MTLSERVDKMEIKLAAQTKVDQSVGDQSSYVVQDNSNLKGGQVSSIHLY